MRIKSKEMSLAVTFFRQGNWTRVHSFKVSSVTTTDSSHENIRKLCIIFFFSKADNAIRLNALHVSLIIPMAIRIICDDHSFIFKSLSDSRLLTWSIFVTEARSKWQEDRQAHFWAWKDWVVELFTFNLSSEPRKWVGTRIVQAIQVQNCNIHIPHLQCSCKTVKNNK